MNERISDERAKNILLNSPLMLERELASDLLDARAKVKEMQEAIRTFYATAMKLRGEER
jgi:hypothetical protein